MTEKRDRYHGEEEADCRPRFPESNVLLADITVVLYRATTADPRALGV